MLSRSALRFEMLAKVGDVIGERPLALIGKRIDQPGLCPLGFADEFVESLLRGSLVSKQLRFPQDASPIAIASRPQL